jgi:hypothetical protein
MRWELTPERKTLLLVAAMFLSILVVHLAIDLILEQEENLNLKQGIIDQLQNKGPMQEPKE